jgi:hypothetical protein
MRRSSSGEIWGIRSREKGGREKGEGKGKGEGGRQKAEGEGGRSKAEGRRHDAESCDPDAVQVRNICNASRGCQQFRVWADPLIQESSEIVAIISTIIVNAKSNPNRGENADA